MRVGAAEMIAYWPLQGDEWLTDIGPRGLHLTANAGGVERVERSAITPSSAFPAGLADGSVVGHAASVTQAVLRPLTGPDDPALRFDREFTVELFLRPRAFAGNANHLVSQFASATPASQRSWAVLLDAGGEIELHLSATGASQDAIGSGLVLEAGKDYFVAVDGNLADSSEAGITFTVKNLTDDLPPVRSQKAHTVTSLFDSTAGIALGSSYNGSGSEQGIDALLAHVRLSSGRRAPGEMLFPLPAPALSAPVLSPAGGLYPGMVRPAVALPAWAEGVRITIDGSDPATAGAPLDAAPALTTSTTVRAVGVAGGQTGAEAAAAFTIAPMTAVGKIRRIPASEVTTSDWGIGAETLDRGFSIYDNWKEFLGPLGAKHARIQSGWARCEPAANGVYDFVWLDAIVDDMLAQGVRPWMNLVYGNPAYPDGGKSSSDSPLPQGDALDAWDAWVAALVRHFRDRVHRWEVWNEPNYRGIPASNYAAFYQRTAQVVRTHQPGARMVMGALAHMNIVGYTTDMLGALGAANAGLVNQVSYHPYNVRPEAMISTALSLRSVVQAFNPAADILQGECGMPSTATSYGYTGNRPWTELSQAKWVVRRMVSDRFHAIPTSIFCAVDLAYPSALNTKGMLKSNLQKTVEYAKPSYAAYQHTASLLGEGVVPDAAITATSATPELSAQGYRRGAAGPPVVLLWFGNAAPDESTSRRATEVEIAAAGFSDPLYVDLIEGIVFRLPPEAWEATTAGIRLLGIPLWDAPAAIVEASAIDLVNLGYPLWRDLRFAGGRASEPNTGLWEDHDGNGAANAWDYLTRDPAGQGPPPALAFEYDAGEFRFPFAPPPEDLRISAETSADLNRWAPLDDLRIEWVTSGTRAILVCRVPSNEPRLFLRLVAATPPADP